MMAAIAVVAFIALVLGVMVYWFKNDGENAPTWLLDDEPHKKYDEGNDPRDKNISNWR